MFYFYWKFFCRCGRAFFSAFFFLNCKFKICICTLNYIIYLRISDRDPKRISSYIFFHGICFGGKNSGLMVIYTMYSDWGAETIFSNFFYFTFFFNIFFSKHKCSSMYELTLTHDCIFIIL